MKRVEFFRHDLGEPHLASLRQTLGTLFLSRGPRVEEFEAAFAAYLGAPHAVGVSSCSMALLLALRALGVSPGDEVVTSPMTFLATSNAVLLAGAIPVFVDIDPGTGLIDPVAAEAAITEATRALLVVHLYGQMADMRAFRRIADAHGLALVEDAAHAIEAERDGVRPAMLGDAAAFSFYATKTMTCGDGGALVVGDAALAERLRCMRNHGMTGDAAARFGGSYRHFDMFELGYKASLTDVQAALLIPQIAHLETRRQRRAALVRRYRQALEGCAGVRLLDEIGGSAHYLFAVLVPRGERDRILEGLGRRGIGCAVNYRSIHRLSYYRHRFAIPDDVLPNATDFGERTVSLPLWSGMRDEDVDAVVEALIASLAEAHE